MAACNGDIASEHMSGSLVLLGDATKWYVNALSISAQGTAVQQEDKCR